MSNKVDKAIRKYTKLHNIPKGSLRKIRKISKDYNLDLRGTLVLIDQFVAMVNKRRNEAKDEQG